MATRYCSRGPACLVILALCNCVLCSHLSNIDSSDAGMWGTNLTVRVLITYLLSLSTSVVASCYPLLIPSRARRLLGIPSSTMTAVAVTLLRLPLTRLSSQLRSLPSHPPLPPPRRRLSASHCLLSSLLVPGTCPAVAAAVAEAVAAPDEEKLEAMEEQQQQQEAPPSFVLPRLPRPKLDVKERKELASYAHGLGKKLKSQQVGKGGVTPSLVSAFTDNLESNELLKLKIHGNCPGELPDVILQLEESTGSIAVDQIGRSVILYRPSPSKMKKREEIARKREEFARNSARFVKSEVAFEERPRNSASKRFVKSGSTFRTQQKRRPIASKGSSYRRGSSIEK